VTRSPGARIHALRDRVTAYIHGHAVGSGIEIAAFAGTVRATSDARFGLPEIAMGLIPGAGGTVSLSRRIGRHRLLWWALSTRTLDAGTAHRWGLVDELLD
ncbi:MAG TPA: enoyl-CoA hydratase/isomerase family protein, partial [Nocardioides sp.]